MNSNYDFPFSFKGFYENRNISFEDKNWPSPAPSGYYRVSIFFGNIWSITYDNEVTSGIKTSF